MGSGEFLENRFTFFSFGCRNFHFCTQAVLRRAKEAGMDCLDNPLAYVTLHKVDLGFKPYKRDFNFKYTEIVMCRTWRTWPGATTR